MLRVRASAFDHSGIPEQRSVPGLVFDDVANGLPGHGPLHARHKLLGLCLLQLAGQGRVAHLHEHVYHARARLLHLRVA